MGSERIKTIIIDGDINRAKEVQAAMPDYIDASFVRYSEAKDRLKNDKVGLVIMPVDNSEGQALLVYKYIKQDPDKCGLRKVPVVLITADEFSDECMGFFDISDPFFYTGVIDDSELYMAVNEALDMADMLDEDDYLEDSNTDNKSNEKTPEKLIGMVYEMKNSEDEAPRIATYEDKKMQNALASAIGQSKEKAKQVYNFLEEEKERMEAEGEPVHFTVGKYRHRIVQQVKATKADFEQQSWKKRSDKDGDISNLHSISDRVTVEKLLEDDTVVHHQQSSANVMWQNRNIQQAQMMQNRNMQSTPNWSSNVMKAASYNQNVVENKTKVVLIVDTDPNTLKAFKLFLGEGYEITMVESSMKAIDYVVKNRVNIVAIENNLNGVPGTSILKSIKNQPSGINIKAYMLMNEKSSQVAVDRIKNTHGVLGVIKKPIVKKQLIATLNRG